MKKTLVILAAGIGNRYGGAKQITPVGPCGERIIDFSMYDAYKAGFEKIVFIFNKILSKEYFSSDTNIIAQTKQNLLQTATKWQLMNLRQEISTQDNNNITCHQYASHW